MSLRHYNNEWLGCNITLQLSLIVVRSIAVQQARQPLACLTGMHGGIIATRVCCVLVHTGHTSLHGKSTLLTVQSAQKPPLAPEAGHKRKQVSDQQRAESSAWDPAQQQAEQPVQLPAQQSAQSSAVTHTPAQQPAVTEEQGQERGQQNAEQSPQAPVQSQAEKLRAAKDLTHASAQQPAGPPTTGHQPNKKLVTQQNQKSAQKPARQHAEQQVERQAQGPLQKPAQHQPEHEIFDCQGLRLLPKDTPLCCEDAVHNQAGPEHIAAQLNAYLRVDDLGLGDATAILGKIPPPPYDAAAGTAQRNLLAAESGEFACLIMKLSVMV